MIGTLMQIGRAISVAATVIEAAKEKPLSFMPDTPPEPDSLHYYALNYRTAQMYGDTAAALVHLEAFVGRKIEDAVSAERERCAKACEGEALEDPTNADGDIAYDHAVKDCVAAIRKG
jgi:hypothetical protein